MHCSVIELVERERKVMEIRLCEENDLHVSLSVHVQS